MAKRKPKAKNVMETVTLCDQCAKPLGRTCARTNGSAACAAGCGIEVAYYGTSIGETPYFFCSPKCRTLHRFNRVK